ncbi:MAG: hypothetical protein DRN04_10895 [Thermoprotei archaeon]|nr:MAG: hypothetical protein DRN04_10895 [Thermoprotei archaeon]
MVSLKNKLSLINLMRVKLSKYKYELVSLYGVFVWIFLIYGALLYFFRVLKIKLFSLIGILIFIIEALMLICSPLVYKETKAKLLLTRDWKSHFYAFTIALIWNLVFLLWICMR